MKNLKSLLILTSLAAFLSWGCTEEPVNGFTDEASEDEGPPPETGIEEGTPLFLKVSLKYGMHSESAYNLFKECKFDPTRAVGAVMDCNLSIPEGQLYYSDVKFDLGTLAPEKCEMVTFQPYYYLKSEAQRFAHPAQTLPDPDPTDPNDGENLPPFIDCSVQIKPKQCWGGAAPAMIEGFPQKRGLIFIAAIIKATSKELQSEHELSTYEGAGVNYLLTNNLSDTTTTVTQGIKVRVQDTFVQHQIMCLNKWFEPQYTINLNISDENVEPGDPGGFDHFDDWD